MLKQHRLGQLRTRKTLLDSWVWLDATEGGASCRLLGRVSTRWVGPGLTSYNPLTALLSHVPNALLLQLTVLVVNLTRSVPLTSH